MSLFCLTEKASLLHSIMLPTCIIYYFCTTSNFTSFNWMRFNDIQGVTQIIANFL